MNEFGVRIALGAAPGRILGLVLRQAGFDEANHISAAAAIAEERSLFGSTRKLGS